MINLKVSAKFLLLGVIVLLSACGGGGGGDDDDFPRTSGAAEITIDASPRNLDVGDRAIVEITIAHPHPDGINLKLRFPDALAYVASTAKLYSGDNSVQIEPPVNATDGGQTYVIFYLLKSSFGSDDRATLTLELVANHGQDDAKLALDADVGANPAPFDPKVPNFETADDVKLQVRG